MNADRGQRAGGPPRRVAGVSRTALERQRRRENPFLLSLGPRRRSPLLLGSRAPSLVVNRVACPRPTARHPVAARPVPTLRAPRRHRAVLATSAAVVLAVAGAAGYLGAQAHGQHGQHTQHGQQGRAGQHGPAGARPGVGTPAQQAQRWLATNVLAGQRGTYVVSTPALRAEAAGDPSVAGRLHSSATVAVFGPPPGRIEVRKIIPAGDVARILAGAAAERGQAGAALLRNPRLQIGPAARREIGDGRLDMRAAAVLALLAARTDVDVVRIVGDPAETAAGVPARVLVLAVRDRSTLTSALAALPPGFRPGTVTSPVRGQWRLTWPVAVAALRAVS